MLFLLPGMPFPPSPDYFLLTLQDLAPDSSLSLLTPSWVSLSRLHFSSSLGSPHCMVTTCFLVHFPFKTEKWEALGLIHLLIPSIWHSAGQIFICFSFCIYLLI